MQIFHIFFAKRYERWSLCCIVTTIWAHPCISTVPNTSSNYYVEKYKPKQNVHCNNLVHTPLFIKCETSPHAGCKPSYTWWMQNHWALLHLEKARQSFFSQTAEAKNMADFWWIWGHFTPYPWQRLMLAPSSQAQFWAAAVFPPSWICWNNILIFAV